MNLYQPTITGSLSVSGSINISGSINVVGGGGTITGTASYATNAELLDGLDSTVFTLTSSFAAQTASFTAFTSSVNTFTSSLNSFSASILTFTASQNILNGTYATTGSNTFAGIQTINSNLVVTGSITAQTLVVQTVTSSVVYSSGSNVFGNDIANTQTFTGSMNLTGSLTVVTTGTEFQVNANGVKFGNVIGDAHNITGSVLVSGSFGLNKAVPQRQYTQVANANGIVFAIQNAAASNEGYIVGFDAIGSTYLQLSDSANAAKVYLNSSGSSYFAGGSVGIGTSTPNAKLNIFGTEGSNIITPQETLLNIGGNELGNSGGYAGIRLGGADANNYGVYIRGVKQGNYGSYWNTALTFNVTRTSTQNTVDEVMRITSGGEVGIGVTPTSGNRFWVKGSDSTSSNTSLVLQNSASNYIMIANNAGQVTKPLQPFAMGGLDGNQSISLNTFTTLNFSTTVGGFYFANVGSCWNNTTRTFTAPVTGVYMVNVSLMTDSVGQVALYVNGARKHSIPSWYVSSSATWGGSAMIPLTAGEALTLQGYGNAGTITQNQFHTFFAIYLLG